MSFILVVDCRNPKAPQSEAFKNLLTYKQKGIPVVFVISHETKPHAEGLRLYSHYFATNLTSPYNINVWVEDCSIFAPPSVVGAISQETYMHQPEQLFIHKRQCVQFVGSNIIEPYTPTQAKQPPQFFSCMNEIGSNGNDCDSIPPTCWQAIATYYNTTNIRCINNQDLSILALNELARPAQQSHLRPVKVAPSTQQKPRARSLPTSPRRGKPETTPLLDPPAEWHAASRRMSPELTISKYIPPHKMPTHLPVHSDNTPQLQIQYELQQQNKPDSCCCTIL